MKIESLKKLTPRSRSIERYPTGKPDTPPDMITVALGCGRLSDGASMFCRLKYQFQKTIRPQLELHVLVHHLLPLAIREIWRGDIAILPKLVTLALDESLNDAICPICIGSGKHATTTGLESCPLSVEVWAVSRSPLQGGRVS